MGVDPSQVLIDHHKLTKHEWGISLNSVTSFVLFRNAFPMEEDIITFLESEVLLKLPNLAKPYDDLIAKV